MSPSDRPVDPDALQWRSNPDLTPPPGAGTPWTVPDRDPGSPEVMRRRRGPDLRLVPVAVVVWLAVVLTIMVRSPWVAAGLLGVAVLAGAGVCFLGPFRPGTTVAEGPLRVMVRTSALVALVGAAWSARAAWLVARVDRHPLRETTTRLAETVELATAPKQLAGGSVLLTVQVDDLGTVPLFLDARDVEAGMLAWQPGTSLAVEATAAETDRLAMAPLQLSASTVPDVVSPPDGLGGVTAHLRAGLRVAAQDLPGGTGELVPGMVVGDVSMQDPVVREQFLATGLTHLTAVSGANLAIVTGSVLVLVTAWGWPLWSRYLAAFLCLVAFVLLVGPEPSVLRAAVMGVVGLVAALSARRAHGYAALSAAVIVLLAVDPGLAVEYAFILSVAATAGIVALAPLLTRRILQGWTDRRTARQGRHHPPVRWQAMVVGLVSVSLAADLVTAPVIVQMTGVVSPTAVLANVLVGAAVPPVTVIGMLGALVGGVHTGVATVVLWGAAAPAWWILSVAAGLSRVPVLHTPGGAPAAGAVVVVAVGVVLVVVSRRWRRSALVGLLVASVWTVVAVQRGVLVTGPYAVATGQDAALVRVWADDLDEVDWYLGVRPTTSGGPEILRGPAGEDAEVIVVADEAAVMLHEYRLNASSGEESPERTEPTGRPELYVVTACGRSRGMPSRTPGGVPVAFPFRDGMVVLGSVGADEGLYAEGAAGGVSCGSRR
jgi:competence protein ComEC